MWDSTILSTNCSLKLTCSEAWSQTLFWCVNTWSYVLLIEPWLGKLFTKTIVYYFTYFISPCLNQHLLFTPQNTTAHLKDPGEEQSYKTFRFLHWGNVYCVSIKVEGNGVLSASSVSPKQCLHLPERGKNIIMLMMHNSDSSFESNQADAPYWFNTKCWEFEISTILILVC